MLYKVIEWHKVEHYVSADSTEEAGDAVQKGISPARYTTDRVIISIEPLPQIADTEEK